MTGVSSSHFDAIAAEYDESLPAHVVEHYLRQAGRLRARALSARARRSTWAAAPARWPRGWPRAGYEMTGVDPSEGMLEVLRAASAGRRGGAGRRAPPSPSPDDSFDLVLSVAVMHHIADAGRGARRRSAEMVRVARPGGRVLVWDHNPRNPYWRC